MNRIAKNFVNKAKKFNNDMDKLIQAYMLPAFKGMTFVDPTSDGCDNGDTFVRGAILDKKGVSYNYSICIYPENDKVCVEIVRYQNGHLTKIGSTDFWIINSDSADDIVKQKKALDKLLKAK
jgi:hypothetical protein